MNEETIVIEQPVEQPIVEDIIGDEHEVEQPEPEEEKVPKVVQKRIDKVIAQKGAADRRADALEADAALLRRELEQLRQAQPQPKSKPEGAPNPDDFDAGRYDPDYLEALTDYKVKQIFENQQKQATISQRESNVITLQNQAREVHADYDAVEQEFFQHPIAQVPVFREILLESENPAEMAYYLGKNPDELDRISAMNQTQALRYIGRLEAKIASNTSLEQPKKTVSNAPKPIAPLGSAKTAAVATDIADAKSMDEYIRLRQASKK